MVNRVINWVVWILFVGFALATSSLTAYHALHKPFTLDETDIANRSHAIVALGPQGPMIVMGTERGEAMPHPPLCEYVIAGVFKVLGETEAAARGFGFLLFVLTGIILFGLIRELLKNEPEPVRNAAIFMALMLYAVNPLLIQHSMLIDADTICIGILTVLFAYVFVRYESRWLLAVIFAAMCLSKELTPVFVVSGVVVYRALNRQWKQLLWDALFIILGGFLLAALIWVLYCLLTDTDVMIFLHQQYVWRVRKLDMWVLTQRVIRNLPTIIRWPVYWMSAPFFVLLIYSTIACVRRWFRERRLQSVDYLLVTATLVWVPYLLYKPSIDMMKYQYPIYPLYLAVFAYLSARALKPWVSAWPKPEWRWTLLWVLAVACMLGLTAHYYRLGDYILYLFESAHSPRWRALNYAYFMPLFLGALVLILLALWRRAWLSGGLFILSFLLMMPIHMALNLRQTAAYTTVESWMNYGETGMPELLKYLQAAIGPNDRAVLRKDLYYYVRFRFNVPGYENVDQGDFFGLTGPAAIREFMSAPRVPKIIVLDRMFFLFPPRGDMRHIFTQFYRQEAVFGNFVVFRLKEKA